MTVETTYYVDGEVMHRNIPVLPWTRFIGPTIARRNDCTCCLYYLGKAKGKHVCNQKTCPAENIEYDGRVEYTAKQLREMILQEVG